MSFPNPLETKRMLCNQPQMHWKGSFGFSRKTVCNHNGNFDLFYFQSLSKLEYISKNQKCILNQVSITKNEQKHELDVINRTTIYWPRGTGPWLVALGLVFYVYSIYGVMPLTFSLFTDNLDGKDLAKNNS